jgi:hypothetical protein
LRKSNLIALLLALCLLVSFGSHATCLDTDTVCIKAAYRDHVVNHISFWQVQLDKPFAQRIGPAPPELTDYLRLDNIVNGYPNRPTPAAIPADFRREMDAAIAELPESVKHALDGVLAGVYLVHNLGSTGFTESINDAYDKPVAAYVVLDLDALAPRTANQWATWKENSPFRADNETTLQATIETADNDNRKNAIQYILLHEFGHVYSVGHTFHPSWRVEDLANVDLSAYPFTSLSWHSDKQQNKYLSDFEQRFPLRRQVVYYLTPKLDAKQMPDVYTQLEQTSFATLYAATNPFDDFAESFVNYVHTVLMGKPFQIRILRNGATVKLYASCWTEKRCEEKRRVLEEALGGK